MKIDIHKMIGFSKRDKEKYLQACKLVSEGIKNPLFKLLVLNHHYPLPKGGLIKGFYNCDLTNKEVYELITSGKDLYGEADKDIDIAVKAYWRPWSSVIGWTTHDSMFTHINKKYLRRWDVKFLANNILHEYAHNCGLSHSYRWHKMRKYSAPYSLGRIIVQCV